MRARGVWRARAGRSIAALGVLIGCWSCAFALDAALDITQYGHTAWRNREGFARAQITSIAQTSDGYLWLGTQLGLLRFDGVRDVSWQPPEGEPLPDPWIRCLFGARDGTLWIGMSKGLASWKAGELKTYPQLAGQSIEALLQDREGVVWSGSRSPTSGRGNLCAIRTGGVQCVGDDGRFGGGVTSLQEDGKGQLWAAAANGLWRVRPGAPKLQSMPAPLSDSLQILAEGGRGALLVATRDGVVRLADGTATLPFRGLPEVRPARLLRDRDGSVWIGTVDRGLVHLHDGHTDVFGMSDGLSGDVNNWLFEDREGNIWVATSGGLDRFRDVAVPTYSVRQGLSNPDVSSVLASRDGGLWISTRNGLNRWSSGEMRVYASRRNGATPSSPWVAASSSVRDIAGSGLPDSQGSLFEDHRGRIWFGSRTGIGYLDNDRYVAIEAVTGGYVDAITEDATENLWIAHRSLGLLRVSPDRSVRQFPWRELGSQNEARRLVADSEHRGLWLGFFVGGVTHWVDGRLQTSYSAADGLAKGRVNDLRVDRDGTVWVSADGGLSRLKNGRIGTLDSTRGLPCDSVDWMIDDDAGAVWVYTACGIVRIARSELDIWAAAVDQGRDPKPKIHGMVFDNSDGVMSTPSVSSYSPHVAKSPDGRLWFATLSGVGVVDPRRLPHNALPPPVHIEQITADRKTYPTSAGVRLPPLVRDLQIDYTALSLIAPEKVLFRYKLESRDRDWQNAGTRRQAFYTDLPPGSYRFHVIACNNSGVWNEQGALLDFSIAPAYWQTNGFRALCAAALFALLWLAYLLRVRHLAKRFNRTLEVRVEERTRIARELHDTLLQSFQGLLLRFQTVYELFSVRPAEAKQILETAIERAAEAITEGRDAVQGLRSSAIETNDLAQAIKSFGEELAAEQAGDGSAALSVAVEGTSKAVHPILRDEIYRIASEALRNAFSHAAATRIEVELRYSDRQLRLRVRDDGKGIDPKYLGEQGREGHFGLHGMRERARSMGGKLTVWSASDAGTEVELSIPAARAYAAAPRER